MSPAPYTPWSDDITLIWRETAQQASGFEAVTEHRSDPPLYCSFSDGVSQSEFYRSMKAGVAASAQAEVQAADWYEFWPEGYTDLRFAEVRGRRFRVVRSFPQTADTLTIILSEAVR